MLSTLQFWLIWFGLAILSGLIFAALGFVIYKLVDLGRTWIVELPTSPGALANIKRKSLKFGQRYERGSTTSVAGGEKDAIIGDPDAVYPTLRGPLRVIHKETGYNLIAPRPNELPIALRDMGVDPAETPVKFEGITDAEWEALVAKAKATTKTRVEENAQRALTWLRMQVCTPLLYWKAIRTNDHQDWLDTQTGKEHWIVRVFPFVMLMFLVAMGVIAFLLWKILPALQAKAGA